MCIITRGGYGSSCDSEVNDSFSILQSHSNLFRKVPSKQIESILQNGENGS